MNGSEWPRTRRQLELVEPRTHSSIQDFDENADSTTFEDEIIVAQTVIPHPVHNDTLTDEENDAVNQTYYHQIDMERIEEFYREIIQTREQLFEGHWSAPKSEGQRSDGLLQRVYGLTSDKEEVSHSIINGKARAFLKRFASDSALQMTNYFGIKPDTDQDGPQALIEPTDIEEEKKRKEKFTSNILTIEAILFDGDHRNNEINIQFMVNPALG